MSLAPLPAPVLVTERADLADLVAVLADEPRYALDTEFHRERSYFPHVALVQLAWSGGCALVDPLAVDLSLLAKVLDGPGTAVLHAATADLEVLQQSCGTIPTKVFDTQLAAGFLGFATPSLTSLAGSVLGIDLPKGNRLTDWLRRPLAADQLDYAAADVLHLLDLADAITVRLEACDRLAWAEEECEELRRKGWGPPDPDAAWLKMKEGRSLKGRARGVAQAVAAWRERRAAATDQPARFVLADLAVISIASNPPRTVDQLRKVRGVDDRVAKGSLGEQLLAAVEAGTSLADGALRASRKEEVDRSVRPAVALVSAWLSQMGRDLRIDPGLLATRADLAAFLSDPPGGRLATGWRGELLGEPVRRLVDGEFALAFDGKGGLALERRSSDPVDLKLAPCDPTFAGPPPPEPVDALLAD